MERNVNVTHIGQKMCRKYVDETGPRNLLLDNKEHFSCFMGKPAFCNIDNATTSSLITATAAFLIMQLQHH